MAAHIRPYRPSDLDALYEICLRTGDAGGDASHVVDDTRLLGDIYAGPYAELEPEHALVVDDGTGTAAGYVLAALDTRAFEDACEREWWPAVRARRPERPDGRSFDDLLVALIHHPHRQDADVVATHPSHLHIDLLPEAQGGGWGRTLMERLQDALRADGSPGVHLGVSNRNQRAIAFYRHLGYEALSSNRRSHTFGRRL